jgi:hypothetical protein
MKVMTTPADSSGDACPDWCVSTDHLEFRLNHKMDDFYHRGPTIVGLISYVKPGSSTTWKTIRESKRKNSTKKERDQFMQYVISDSYLDA